MSTGEFTARDRMVAAGLGAGREPIALSSSLAGLRTRELDHGKPNAVQVKERATGALATRVLVPFHVVTWKSPQGVANKSAIPSHPTTSSSGSPRSTW